MIAWFARNAVAANLLMVFIISLGLFNISKIPLEVFPAFELDIVQITTRLPAASPQDVEQSLTIRVEDAVDDLTGIKKISSRSSEGSSVVTIEIENGFDARNMLNDIKSRIDAINTFPDDLDRPIISLLETDREVISVAVYGDLSERELKTLGEKIRDDLLRVNNISRVRLESGRDYEVSIEVDETIIKKYKLTLAQIAERINLGSLDLSAGNIRTPGGDVLVRTKGQAYNQQDFAEIVILNRNDGTTLKVKDIAKVIDGFEQDQVITRFNGQAASIIEIYRVGDQSAIKVADKVRNYIQQSQATLPEGVHIDYWRDRSNIVKNRLKTLANSAIQGGILVFLLLTLFLRPMVAVWVCIGIPISFMGAFILMPVMGVTLNIISLFAFILVLGIVVDDAIVTGENIYRRLQEGEPSIDAAILGTQEVAVPVTFGILTTIAAFTPLFFLEGVRGAIFAQIPAIVIPVLLFSLIESKLILPAHLKHIKPRSETEKPNKLMKIQRNISLGFESAVLKIYRPILKWAINNRLLSLTFAISIAVFVFSIVSSGWMKFIFFPRVESETIRVSLKMPTNTAFEITDQYISMITQRAEELQKKYTDEGNGKSLISHILSTSGSSGGSGGGASNQGRVILEVIAPEQRFIKKSVSELSREWRQAIGNIPGAESLSFRAEIGRAGDPIDVQLSGGSLETLKHITQQVKAQLAQYPGVFDITDTLSGGKQELLLKLKPQAQPLGINLSDLARQVRQAFFGLEVQRIQRERNEVKVMVRLPLSQRRSVNNLYSMILTTSNGVQIPFSEVAWVEPSNTPTTIFRTDNVRTANIRADINKQTTNIGAIKRDLNPFLQALLVSYPGINFTLEGEAKEQAETFSSLKWGLFGVLFAIYALLAIPFKSYWQPLIVMSIIPLGLVGAILGHWIMGMQLTIMSILGMLALTGVVVNDSLVLVDYINKRKLAGDPILDAVLNAGTVRFRPVILTSLTTFAGLMPLLFEKSTQAQFLIPMATSLGFGILFATLITLIIIPVNYMLAESLKSLVQRYIYKSV